MIIYMIITGKEYLNLDIWSETPNQYTVTKEMIFTI